jgi:hypothetical protein
VALAARVPGLAAACLESGHGAIIVGAISSSEDRLPLSGERATGCVRDATEHIDVAAEKLDPSTIGSSLQGGTALAVPRGTFRRAR